MARGLPARLSPDPERPAGAGEVVQAELPGGAEWGDSGAQVEPDPAALLDELARSAPSLPIILLSAAAGVSGAIIAFYFASSLAGLGIALSAAAAALGLSFGLGGVGGFLSWATGSRAAVGNIALSCLVILLVLAFMGVCVLAGAIAGTLLLSIQV